jgi:hypothetical protein
MKGKLAPEIRDAVVTDIVRIAKEKYVLPEVGEKTAQAIKTKLEQGEYENIADANELADTLTADLRKVSADRHWQVSYDAQTISALYANAENEAVGTEIDEGALAQLKEDIRRANFGIEKVEHLQGNIGYVDLHQFAWIGFPGAGESVVAAMQLVAHCDALIFDVRQNHGGEVETLQLYVSYFVEPEPKQYDAFHYRPTDETQQFWTMPYVPGKRLTDVPIYILTSGITGSGGEAFAYILKNMRQAIVVGETTLGAAHTTDLEVVQGNFQVEYPSGRSISPFTNSDWEGTGVVPDITVPREKALMTAHLHALEQLIETCRDEERKRELEWGLEIAENQYAPVILEEAILSRYVGQYGDRVFGLADGSLTYSRQAAPATKLIPMAETRFCFDDIIKFEFILDEGETASAVVVSYQGRPDLTVQRGT